MTVQTSSQRHQDGGWSEELAAFLGPGCFPATHDHLAATLIKRRAPSRLLWQLSVVPRSRQFESLDELVDHLNESSATSAHGFASYVS